LGYYKGNYTHGKLISISNEINTYKIEQIHDTLVLNYNGNKIRFIKVSNNYSNNVFLKFITNIIFNNHNSLTLTAPRSSKAIKVTKDNTPTELKKILKCDLIDAVQLGTFKYGSKCLPETAAYRKVDNQWGNPQIFGVLVEPDKITLIDSSMRRVAILKPN
jgi:hypothetical protein